MERSLVLIKPDGVEKNVIGKILDKYESNGLKIVNLKMLNVSEEIAVKHYEEHKEKKFFNELIEYIRRGPVCALIIEGEDAINRVRSINGSTDPKKAEEGTLRALYGKDITENCVHASDCILSAKREIDIWFS